jgi:hypothetical protein
MGKRDTFRKAKPRATTTFDYNGESFAGLEPTAEMIRDWQNSYRDDDGQVNQAKLLLADEALLCIVVQDDEGQPIATFDEVYGGLFNLHPCRGLNTLTTQVSAFCALDATERRALRDAIKNLRADQSNESSSSSPPAEGKPQAK